ncbi:MAG: hypothetical protein JWQ59_2045 [Cryobacterium sp.]|jgi:hypothetical protein|nr:hypothetical protein [Cryobacterium sp.]
MFGRRRRVAPVVQAPAPELSDAQIFELLHGKLAELIGATGTWTLVPRQGDDTDVIFHDLKAEQIAGSLTGILANGKAVLRGEREAEPTALPWTPAPISVWAEPTSATVSAPIQLPAASPAVDQAQLVA